MIENESLKTLEFEKIIAMLADRAGSVLGKELAHALRPSSDYEEAAEWQAETAEAVSRHLIGRRVVELLRGNCVTLDEVLPIELAKLLGVGLQYGGNVWKL